MRICHHLLIATALAVCAAPLVADTPVPQYSLLIDVPGCNHAGTAVAPMWPLTDWLGASVEDGGEWAIIRRGPQVVYLQLPRSMWTSELPIVPLRTVAECVGAQVRYHGADSEIGAQLGHTPVVALTLEAKQGLVIVHAAPPAVVQAIIDDVADDRVGIDYLLRVSALAGDWAKTHEPQFDEAYGFAQRWVTGVLRRTEEGWAYVLRSSNVSYTQAELAEAGVPLEVARQLGMEIEEL